MWRPSLGPGPVWSMRSPRPRRIPDKPMQWQRVGCIYWLDMARSISFWFAFVESCSPVIFDHPFIHISSTSHWFLAVPIDLLPYLLIRLIALLLLFLLCSAAGHRSHPSTTPFQYLPSKKARPARLKAPFTIEEENTTNRYVNSNSCPLPHLQLTTRLYQTRTNMANPLSWADSS